MKRLDSILKLIGDDPLELIRPFQEDLWTLVFGEWQLHTFYVNPLREDSSPGCSFYYDNENNLRFNDFAHKNYTILEYTMSLKTMSLKDAQSFLIKSSNTLVPKIPEIKKAFDVSFVPSISSKLSYFKLNIYWVKQFKVKALTGYYYNGKRYAFDVSYLYIFPDGGIKVYNPYAEKKYKWKLIKPTSCVDGEWLLDNTIPYLVLVSSRKDAITAYTLGVRNVVAPVNGESNTVNFKYLIDKYKLNLQKIYIIPDNNKAGEKFCLLHIKDAEELNIPAIKYGLPNNIDVSDPYEVYEISKKLAKKWIQNLLTDIKTLAS